MIAGMRLESVQVGQVTVLEVGDRAVRTGHDKRPVEGALVTPAGLTGDAVVDTRHHGGADQALYCYAAEDLAWWAAELGGAPPPGRFGENLTVSSFGGDPCIGDQLLVGDDVVIELTGPRIPCATFAARMGDPGWVRRFRDARRPGCYARVLAGGEVRPGDRIEVRADAAGVTVVELFDAHYDRSTSPAVLRRLLDTRLAERARADIEGRLAGSAGT